MRLGLGIIGLAYHSEKYVKTGALVQKYLNSSNYFIDVLEEFYNFY